MRPAARVSLKRLTSSSRSVGPGRPNISRSPTMSSRSATPRLYRARVSSYAGKALPCQAADTTTRSRTRPIRPGGPEPIEFPSSLIWHVHCTRAAPACRAVQGSCTRCTHRLTHLRERGYGRTDNSSDPGRGAAGGAIAGGGKGAGKGAAIGSVVGAGGGTLYGLNESKKHDERYREAYAGCMRSRGYAG